MDILIHYILLVSIFTKSMNRKVNQSKEKSSVFIDNSYRKLSERIDINQIQV